MKQVVQNIRTGATTVQALPDPLAPTGGLLIANAASVISAGTERYVVDLAKQSLLGKARQRPDHVRRVVEKIRQEGLLTTATQVFAKLNEPMPLGYATSGVVLECGRGVQDFKVGDRVAAAAPHAGVVAVSRNLCARIPDGVSFADAAYATLGAIALQGVRLAQVNLGERVLVIGLGLMGQMAAALLRAQGCRVYGLDIDPKRVALALDLGIHAASTGSPRDAIMAFADGFGVDAVLITAATSSNAPIELAADVCRVRGRIVLVGVAGLTLPRAPFFQKELSFRVSSSLGPGRGDPMYEERGIDYPVGYARWTAQRNMGAVLEAIANGSLPVHKLTSHTFKIEDAPRAYDLVTNPSEPVTGIVLTYPPVAELVRRVTLREAPSQRHGQHLGISVVGAGNFARLVMLPALKKLPGLRWRGLASAKGLNASQLGQTAGFDFVATDIAEVLADPDTQVVFLATRHNLHAEQVIRCLRAGKHVFVEKPLCIHPAELSAIAACVADLGPRCPILTVGFNRRFAPATQILARELGAITPLSTSYRFATGPIPPEAWPQDEDVGGGRIIGEACHAIDFCTALCGSEPVRVYAESVAPGGSTKSTDDRVFITMRHANGSISNVSYQAGADKAGPTERIEVFGGGKSATLEGWDALSIWQKGAARHDRCGRDKGHARALTHFIGACRDTGPWPIPWEHLESVAWASMAAMASLRLGLPITRAMELGDPCAA